MLATCLLAGFAESISSTLKKEAICSSETSVETERTTWRHIPEDDTLQGKMSPVSTHHSMKACI
jgi:hypothetical protein